MPTIGRDTTISWLGHGTFHITTPGGKRLLLDAWVDTNPACPDAWKQRVKDEGLDAIFVTHGHADHINDLLSGYPYRELFALHPDNTFLVKVAYWLSR